MDFGCTQIKTHVFEGDNARKLLGDIFCLKDDRLHVQFLCGN